MTPDRAQLADAELGSWDWRISPDPEKLRWSPRALEILGWPVEEALTFGSFVQLVHPDDRATFLDGRATALAGERPFRMDVRVVRPDGDGRHVHMAAEVLRRSDGRAERVVGVLQDRTEEIGLQRRIRTTEASRRHLLQRLLDAGDHQRERVARHLATGPVAQLEALRTTLEHEVGADAPQAWHDVLEGVHQSIASLEETLGAMEHAADRSDIADVVAELAADATELEVQVEVRLHRPPAPAVRSVAVRLVQEALQNVRKHAKASSVAIAVHAEDDAVHVQVHDDGRGFAPAAVGLQPGRFGLASLREDVADIGGTFDLRSGPAGTTVSARLPMR